MQRERKLFALGGVLIALMYIWRLSYGYAELDESFYLTVPFRLLKGDSLLVDEWHVTQLSGFLLTPFMAFQRYVVGSMEGVALNFRIFWLIKHMAVMTGAYLMLEKKNALAAVAAAWVYGLFTPFGIMAMSYNSLGVDAVFLLAILFCLEHDSAAADVFKGFLMAVLVLCNPYTLSVYAMFMLFAAAYLIRKKESQFSPVHVLRWHLGIAILLIPFAVHLLCGVDSLTQLAQHLRCILQDPAHESKSFFDSQIGWMKALIGWNPEFFRAYALVLAAGLLIRRIRPYAMSLIALICAYYVLRDARYFKYIWDGNSMVMFCFFAGAAAFLFREKKSLHALWCTYLLPFVFALCVNLASNQGLRSVLVAFMPACCLGIIQIGEYYREHRFVLSFGRMRIPVLAMALAAAFGVQMCAQGFVRVTQVFWEWEPPTVLTAKIESGPQKGLRTIPQKKADYERLCAELESLGDLSEKKIAFFGSVPVGILAADAQVGAPSGWMEFKDLLDARLAEYYRLNPHKKPDYFFIDRLTMEEEMDAQCALYAEQNGYTILSSNDRCIVLENME